MILVNVGRFKKWAFIHWLRIRLENVITKGRHLEPPYPDVDALIWKGERQAWTKGNIIPLTGTDSSNGLFAGEVFGLDPDSYEMSVRFAPGILDEMEFSDQRLRFNVRPEANKEKDFLTCDENLLTKMSEISGGSFSRRKF